MTAGEILYMVSKNDAFARCAYCGEPIRIRKHPTLKADSGEDVLIPIDRKHRYHWPNCPKFPEKIQCPPE